MNFKKTDLEAQKALIIAAYKTEKAQLIKEQPRFKQSKLFGVITGIIGASACVVPASVGIIFPALEQSIAEWFMPALFMGGLITAGSALFLTYKKYESDENSKRIHELDKEIAALDSIDDASLSSSVLMASLLNVDLLAENTPATPVKPALSIECTPSAPPEDAIIFEEQYSFEI